MYNSSSQKKLREFALVMGFGLPIIIGYLLPLISGHNFRIWTIWFGVVFLILGFLKPSLLSLPYKGWMKLGHILGWINSRIILGFVFLIVLQPIALIMRVCGHDPLRKKKGMQRSYREKIYNKKIDLKRIF